MLRTSSVDALGGSDRPPTLTNPWRDLPSRPPYVLPEDAPRLRGQPGIHLDVMPCPYLGAPTGASVFVLNLNPSYTSASASYVETRYCDEWRRSLTFQSAYPFWAF